VTINQLSLENKEKIGEVETKSGMEMLSTTRKKSILNLV